MPAAVVATQQVTLSVSTSAYGGHATYAARVLLLVNDTPMPALVIGPGLKVDLERKHLRPGVNVLKFLGFNDTNRIDVYDMRIELAAAPPGREGAKPQASTQTGEAGQPPAREPAKAVDGPAAPRVDPRPPEKTPAPRPAQPPAPTVATAEGPKPDAAAGPPPAPATVKAEEPKQAAAPVRPAAPLRAPVQPEGDPGQRWAVVVGFSEYEDSRIPSLRYAARDAQVFHDWLVAPTGGRYAPSKVKLLLNRNATNEKIKDALFYYLLEGLKGAADFDRSGSVSVGEVTVFVSQQVRRATRNAQNPIVAGRFDPSLVIGK